MTVKLDSVIGIPEGLISSVSFRKDTHCSEE